MRRASGQAHDRFDRKPLCARHGPYCIDDELPFVDLAVRLERVRCDDGCEVDGALLTAAEPFALAETFAFAFAFESAVLAWDSPVESAPLAA